MKANPIPLLLLLLLLIPQPTSAAPLTQSDPMSQCIEGTALFFDDKTTEALPLLEAGFAGREQAVFADPDDLGKCAWALATLHKRAGDLPAAEKIYLAALETFQNSGSREYTADTLDTIGEVYDSLRRYDEALSAYQEALVIHQELGDRSKEETALSNIGLVYHKLGRYREALDTFEQRLVINRELNNRSEEAVTLNNIGFLQHKLDRYQEALAAYQQSLVIKQELGDRNGEGIALDNIGRVYETQGRYQEALTIYEQALTIRREVDNREGESITLNNIGVIYKEQGRYEDALKIYEQSLAIDRKLGRRDGEAITLNNMGLVYEQFGQYEQALEVYEQSLAIRREMKNRAGESIVLNNMGLIYDEQGRYEEALVVYEQSLAIDRELGRKAGEATTLNNIATVYESQGRYTEALATHKEALAIRRALGNRSAEAITLANMGLVYKQQGRYEQALTAYQEALRLFREKGNRASEGTVLNNIGGVYENLSRYQEALLAREQALAIHREVGNRPGEASTLTNIGLVYSNQGRYQKALDTLEQALAVIETTDNEIGKAPIFNGMGFIYNRQGQYKKALLVYEQSLAIYRQAGERGGEQTLLNNIGAVYKQQGQYQKALIFFEQALTITREIGSRADEALTLNNIGVVHRAQGHNEEALTFYEQSLSIRREVGDRVGERIVLSNMSGVYYDQKRYQDALAAAQQAIDIGEAIRATAGSEQGRSSFIAQYTADYDFVVDLLHRQGQDEAAFFTTERGRARSFLDSLATGTVQLSDNAAADLLAQEQAAYLHRQTLQDKLAKTRAQSPSNPTVVTELETQLAQAEKDYAGIRAAIESHSDQLVELLPGRSTKNVLGVSDIQAYLDPHSTLLAYYMLDDLTLAFLITPNHFKAVELGISRDDLIQKVTFLRKLVDLQDTEATHRAAQELYQLLIEPVAASLDTPRLLIVPHGELHYLPFAALLDPNGQYLIQRHSLVILPSASSLPFIQKNADKQTVPKEQTPPEQPPHALILGNPSLTQLVPLPFAEKEAEAIAALYHVEPLLQDTATESVVHEQAAGARALHLAAHGQYNPAAPLNSLIALAPDQTNDGALTVSEIYGLDLHQTDLVTLSACQTQLSNLSAGDDVIGLTRAFIFAGTPTVVASLWNVNDAATGFLMTRFYTHLAAGLSKSEALRQAQLETMAEYPDPFYWAAFVLSGDGGDAESPEDSSVDTGKKAETQRSDNFGGVWLIGSCSLLIIGLVVVVVRRGKQPKRL